MDNSTISNLLPRGAPTIIAFPNAPPYTTPALTANLFFRVFLGLLSNLVCLVPLRQLWLHGEFAATIFLINVEFKNLLTVTMSLIWRNDDVASWWPGYGLCDVSSFFHNFCAGVYLTCLLAIVRNLAHQVGILRANPMTTREKRRRNLIQALIIFPLPAAQVVCTGILTAQRYAIATLVGCSWVGYGAWPYLVFFIVGPMIVALLTAGYAIFTYFRFRDLAKETEAALSSNRAVNMRAQRTKRRLYLMVVSILIPFLPVIMTLMILNIVDMGEVRPFDWDAIRNRAYPYPWNSIIYLTSDQISFALMNNGYICMFTAVPAFCFFGMTKDAMNDYRRVLLLVGLGRVFPKLREVYDPDRSAFSGSFASSQRSTPYSKLKFQSMTSSQELQSLSSRSDSVAPVGTTNLQSLDLIVTLDAKTQDVQPPPAVQPAPPRTTDTPEEASGDAHPEMRRNPFLLRTTLDLPFPIKFPFLRSSEKPDPSASPRSGSRSPRWGPNAGVSTRVWSDDETRLVEKGNKAPEATDGAEPERDVVPLTENPTAGVHVETSLTRETHRASQQRR